jgi:hypothetical protein
MTDDFAVTSPNLSVKDGIVKSSVEFSNALTLDLTDEQISLAWRTLIPIINKWREKFVSRFALDARFDVDRAMELVDQMEEEIKYRLMETCQLIVSVDVTPLLEGQGIVISFDGVLPSHEVLKYGFDHERKGYEVVKAKERGEAFLGQKEDPNRQTKTKKRANDQSS